MKIIESIKDMSDLLNDLTQTDKVYLDIEASSLDVYTATLYTIQVGTTNDVYVIDCLKFKDISYIVKLLSPKIIIGHNLKYDIHILNQKTGIIFENVYDTMLAEILINQGVGQKFYSLKDLVLKYCGIELNKDVRESFYANGLLTQLTMEQYIYAAEDIVYLKTIMDTQLKLVEQAKLGRVLDLEMKVLPAVISMEANGITLDKEKWIALMVLAREKAFQFKQLILDNIISRLDISNKTLFECCELVKLPVKTKRDEDLFSTVTDTDVIKKYLTEYINISSPKQMLAILNLLGFKVESTGEKVLKELNSNDELIVYLLEYRENVKKSSSFGQGFIDKLKEDGKIHSEFNQLATDTGRFSSTNPNMQQIIAGSDYRDCFIASPGHKIVAVDFSQQELRLAGAISQEPSYLSAYNENKDLHTATASAIYNVPYEEVTKEQRRKAKSLNFAINYGSSAQGLVYNFGFSEDEANFLLKRWTEVNPVLDAFKTAYENVVVEKLYSITLLGRRRYFESKNLFQDRKEYDKYIRAIKREGFNQLIQGTGADITKLSLVNIYTKNPFGDKLKLVLCIHDEIVCEVSDDIVDEAVKFISDCMIEAEQPFLNGIPAEVSPSVGEAWKH